MGFRNRLVGLFRVAMLLSILGSLLMPLAQVSAAAAIGSDETSDVRVEGPADLDWVIQNPGGDYGYAVGTAGDVNGDGYADVIIGAPMVNPQTAVGQAQMVGHGRTDPFPVQVLALDGRGLEGVLLQGRGLGREAVLQAEAFQSGQERSLPAATVGQGGDESGRVPGEIGPVRQLPDVTGHGPLLFASGHEAMAFPNRFKI